MLKLNLDKYALGQIKINTILQLFPAAMGRKKYTPSGVLVAVEDLQHLPPLVWKNLLESSL